MLLQIAKNESITTSNIYVELLHYNISIHTYRTARVLSPTGSFSSIYYYLLTANDQTMSPLSFVGTARLLSNFKPSRRRNYFNPPSSLSFWSSYREGVNVLIPLLPFRSLFISRRIVYTHVCLTFYPFPTHRVWVLFDV